MFTVYKLFLLIKNNKHSCKFVQKQCTYEIQLNDHKFKIIE